MIPWVAPMAYAPIAIPSSTACGLPSMTERSMNAPGTPSSPLQITYFRSPGASRHSRPFRPVGGPGAAAGGVDPPGADVVLDAGRVDVAVLLQHDPLLRGIEGDLA